MRHWVFNVAALLSLLMLVATAAAWARGRNTFTTVFWIGEHHYEELSIGRTGCTVGRGLAYGNTGTPSIRLVSSDSRAASSAEM